MFYYNPNTGDTTNALVWIIIAIIAVAIIVTLIILLAKRKKNNDDPDDKGTENVFEKNLEDIKADSDKTAQSLEAKLSSARKSAGDIKNDLEDKFKKD